MSHEGFRIGSREEARAAASAEPPALSLAARTPARVRVKKTEGTGVEIDWADGHRSAWTFAFLRDACPCATCHEAREQTGRAPGEAPPRPQSLLPMYQDPPRPREVEAVGKYAVRFNWNDGHTSGIYSWEFLRGLCHCPVCAGTP